MVDVRSCIRGCAVRGVHLAVCADFGKVAGEGSCPGCAPVEARDGVLICERDYRRLRSLLEDAADIVGHLRSIADPTKVAAFDRLRVQASMPELPAPVASDLIDASEDITRTLNAWANHLAGVAGARGLHAGAEADEAHEIVQMAADVILDELDRIANDSHNIVVLCDAVLTFHPGNPVHWSVADAAVRYPVNEAPRYAAQPCPRCDLMTVWIQPGRRRPTRYVCVAPECEWQANELDDDGLWSSVFVEDVPAEVRPHDPELLTLQAAARVAGRTVGTIRRWILRGYLEREDGRVRRSAVLEVLDEMEQGSDA